MLAQVLDTKIILLHVIDINDPGWATYCGCAAEFMRHLKTEAERHMRELLSSLGRQAVEIKLLVVEGLPCQEILHALRPSSLLLIPRPTPKRFWRLFSKKTCERLLEDAKCTLMVCPS
jgi:hypothetical protein